MAKMTLVLLPGLNGTVGLFNPLLKYVTNGFEVLPIAYPEQEILSYSALVSFVLKKLESVAGNYILLGESFSGPIALRISERKPKGLVGVILVASFITAPNLNIGRFLPWKTGFSLLKPFYGISLDRSNKQSLIAGIFKELQNISPQVLACRIQAIFTVNVTESLRNCEVPIVYFRGMNDYLVPGRNLKNIMVIKPSVKVVDFKTQHFILQSKPKQACVAIQKFVNECGHQCGAKGKMCVDSGVG